MSNRHVLKHAWEHDSGEETEGKINRGGAENIGSDQVDTLLFTYSASNKPNHYN